MRSKITIFAAILVLVAGAFAYNNYTAHEAEKVAEAKADRDLQATNKVIAEEEDLIAAAKKRHAELVDECNRLDQQHTDLIASNEKLTSDIAQKTADLETVTKQLADIEERSKGMKDVAQLAAEIERTEQDNNRLTEELAANTAKRDALVERSAQIEKSVEALNKLEADQLARISPASLRTTIRNVYDDWGFVVLSAGADQGIVLGSKLAVMRGGAKVAELLVNNVENAKASADVVPASKDESIRLTPGDVVVSIRP